MNRSNVASAAGLGPIRGIAAFVSVAALAGCSERMEAPLDTNATNARAENEIAADVGSRTIAAPAVVCEEPGRYDAGESVVVDRANGRRLWQRQVDPTTRTQPDALAYCAALVLGDRAGWRLPSVQELHTLLLHPTGLGRPDACYPAIDQRAFPGTPIAEFWTSSTRPSGDGLYTGFDDGRTHPASLDAPFFVRCVHDADAPPDPDPVPVR